MIHIIGLKGIPIVKEGDDIAKLIVEAAKAQGIEIKAKDVFVIAQTIVSRAEGSVVDLNTVVPSDFAMRIAERFEKDPRQIEVILREAKQIIRMEHAIITETKHGFICANSGVDKSNMPGEHFVSLLPRDPEKSARELRKELEKLTGVKLAVIISDTHGRPFREGAINVAIGVSGMKPVWDRRGDVDLFGYTLKSTLVGIADELASAAELVMGEANEGIPVVIIRGFDYIEGEGSIKDLLRTREKDMFR
ncbi:MAG: coenzyme F420-0:L-glutamate ligase [Candidatus Freyarchaeota archaeon]|nr:coenzyme F420-0:L-glutamate ligase [Candidatus Jordarchaeia archaeon]MBS7269075.1 coenzyme F420-0:L-glutamate ligase [Candidatus Jordarchaeia archaeon]MBS7279903.1 coenzyme F420-0:L-glutamate ligase [Candidatus Jordarchaeia archaeon]